MKKNKFVVCLEIIITCLTLFALAFVWSTKCSQERKVVRIIEEGNGPEQPTCGQAKLGTVRELECDVGYQGTVIEVCEEDGWVERFSGCQQIPDPEPTPTPDPEECAEGEVSFDEVRPLIVQYCADCHSAYTSYDIARQKLRASIIRMRLPDTDLRKMPKGSKQMSEEEIATFETWRNSGEKKTCDPSEPQEPVEKPHLDLDYIEGQILQDLNQFDQDDRETIRYLVTTHKFDAGFDDGQLLQLRDGINKTVNSMSFERRLKKAEAIDLFDTIYRIDLEDYDMDVVDWNDVENFDPINFESFTTAGQIIKLLANTRKPWMHADNFAFSIMDPAVYYDVLELDQDNFNTLIDKIGVDFFGDIDDFEAQFLGFNGSPISINKNRLMYRTEGDDGYFWMTFDPIDPTNSPERNLFQNPLLGFIGIESNFIFDAGEIIWTLPNGLQGYFLINNQGVRQDAAPIDIVQDTNTPFSPEIRNAISCHRCHSTGLLESEDEIRDHVIQNASEFNRDDVEVVQELFRPNSENVAAFAEDNRLFANALQEIGININQPDPINYMTDFFRKDYNIREVASFLFLSEDDFRLGLNQSAQAKAQVGQLLTGGRITLAQLIETLPVLIEDLRIGQDPIGR